MKIPTKDSEGNPNGYLVPLWNCHEQDWRPDQVYETVVAPGARKGPHLHENRVGRFFCLSGGVQIIVRTQGVYRRFELFPEGTRPNALSRLHVPAGVPSEIRNLSETEEARLLNMPTPAWTPEDPDEHEVEDWNP